MTDAELVQACLNRQEAAWSELHRRFCGLIYHCILRLFSSAAPEDVQDIHQNVYWQLLQGALQKYRPEMGSLATYIGLIATRQTINFFKSRQHQHSSRAVELSDYTVCFNPLESQADDLTLEAALKTLKADEYELLRLRFAEDLNLETLAAMKGASIATLSRRLKKILKKVQEAAKR